MKRVGVHYPAPNYWKPLLIFGKSSFFFGRGLDDVLFRIFRCGSQLIGVASIPWEAKACRKTLSMEQRGTGLWLSASPMGQTAGQPQDREMDINREPQIEIEADFILFEEISSAKLRFFDAIVENRRRGSAVKVVALRQDSIFEIAKFFLPSEAMQNRWPEKVTGLRHMSQPKN